MLSLALHWSVETLLSAVVSKVYEKGVQLQFCMCVGTCGFLRVTLPEPSVRTRYCRGPGSYINDYTSSVPSARMISCLVLDKDGLTNRKCWQLMCVQ